MYGILKLSEMKRFMTKLRISVSSCFYIDAFTFLPKFSNNS